MRVFLQDLTSAFANTSVMKILPARETLHMDISKNIEATRKEIEFSGVISVKAGDDLIHSSAHGYSNRADEIMNTTETRFGIASGCKLFTAIAICQLIQKRKLRFDSKLNKTVFGSCFLISIKM
jgi:CubicO group peptidase (beta-lactamase class C family)